MLFTAQNARGIKLHKVIQSRDRSRKAIILSLTGGPDMGDAQCISAGAAMIDKVSGALSPRYDPRGWMQWPDNEPYCFQFMKVLGAAQECGRTISERFLTAT